MTAIYILIWLGIACIVARGFCAFARNQHRDPVKKLRRAGF